MLETKLTEATRNAQERLSEGANTRHIGFPKGFLPNEHWIDDTKSFIPPNNTQEQ